MDLAEVGDVDGENVKVGEGHNTDSGDESDSSASTSTSPSGNVDDTVGQGRQAVPTAAPVREGSVNDDEESVLDAIAAISATSNAKKVLEIVPVARSLAAAKMLARSGLRCSCHYEYIWERPG